jgi:hypothetical protein
VDVLVEEVIFMSRRTIVESMYSTGMLWPEVGNFTI